MATIKQVREFCAKTFPRYKIDKDGRIERWQTETITGGTNKENCWTSPRGWHFAGWLDVCQKVGPDVLLTTIEREIVETRNPAVFAA